MFTGPRLTISSYMTRPGTRKGQAGTSGDNLEIQGQTWLDIDKHGWTLTNRDRQRRIGTDRERQGTTGTGRDRQ